VTESKPIMRIQLDAAAQDRLDAICERRGMTHIAVMSRLLTWFARQDDYIHTAILHPLSRKSIASLAKSRLKSLDKLSAPHPKLV
jgi:hypothetical protein